MSLISTVSVCTEIACCYDGGTVGMEKARQPYKELD